MFRYLGRSHSALWSTLHSKHKTHRFLSPFSTPAVILNGNLTLHPPSLLVASTGVPHPCARDTAVDPANVWLGPIAGKEDNDEAPAVTVESELPLLPIDERGRGDVDADTVTLSFE